ncbi:MAG TPA: methylmalonyl-CoA mutase family protein [Candidatus Thalassarchaeaceae archaeon]|nr:methylmalonyl-CoA mutase family protein [Candidatus Thalassarchaeaceae archaeon]
MRLRKDSFETLGGLPISPIPGPEDSASESETPGTPPYTRGVHETMYRSRLWTMRQYAGFSSAEETNTRFRTLLDRGQSGLSVAFDLPTQLGLDSDDPLSFGEVGRVGVAIDSILDMRELFNQIQLDQVSTSMTINSPAIILLALYIAVGEEQGAAPDQLRGTVQNDILKEYIARGTHVFPPEPSMRLITDVIGYCAEKHPAWNTISISGYHIREAGATAVEELAFTLSNALAYVDAALSTGMDIDDFAPRLSFFFGCHNDFFEEVAKFRAARRLWHRLMNERYQPKNPKSSMLRFHTQTAGVTLTAQQPLNNVSRVAYQAMSAVLGGTQSLHTNSYDEAIGLPTDESATIALRTQQILAEETGVADVVDPMAGSYHVEALTDKIESEAYALICEIDEMGGALAALKTGFQQRRIHESAWKQTVDVEKQNRMVIGVNHARIDKEPEIEGQVIDPLIAEQQLAKLAELRGGRNAADVASALSALTVSAGTDENLFPLILHAVKVHCSVGEIMNALKEEFGTWMAPSGF